LFLDQRLKANAELLVAPAQQNVLNQPDARSEGEDLFDPEAALSCEQVFALGGRPGAADAAERWGNRAAACG